MCALFRCLLIFTLPGGTHPGLVAGVVGGGGFGEISFEKGVLVLR